MKKALQESTDFSWILTLFWKHFSLICSRKASKINKMSGCGLERPLEASGGPLGSLWRRLECDLGTFGGKSRRDGNLKGRTGGIRGVPLLVEISTEFDRLIQSRPAHPEGAYPGPVHSARPTPEKRPDLFFGVQKRIQNSIRFLNAFLLLKLPQASKNYAKIH